MENLTHSDLSFLKELKKYSFDSKMMLCQQYASRIMTPSEVRLSRKDAMPWELEVFALFSTVYDDELINTPITADIFAEIITKIRNFWHPELTIAEKNGTYADAYIMISAIQQFPVQGAILQKFFRYSYVFNFENENMSFKKEFKKCFGADYSIFDVSAFLTYLACCNSALCKQNKEKMLNIAFSDKQFFQAMSIDKVNYLKELQDLYKNSDLDYYYGLKMQYWWPIIETGHFYYIPLPYLIINACTESLLQRVTEGNTQLRNAFGKEVIETYLYEIYSEISSVSWVSREFTYKVGHQEYRTSDVIAGEDGYCIFFETKALSPSLKLRKFDQDEIDKNIKLYAAATIEVNKQIQNYMNGDFSLSEQFGKEQIFGVVIVWDDSSISRQKVYDYTFTHLELDQREKDYIHSHIKIVSLRSLEYMVLQNTSLLKSLKDQAKDSKKWNNYSFVDVSTENGSIPLYEKYTSDLKYRAKQKLKRNGLL